MATPVFSICFPFCARWRALSKFGPLSLPFKERSSKVLAVRLGLYCLVINFLSVQYIWRNVWFLMLRSTFSGQNFVNWYEKSGIKKCARLYAIKSWKLEAKNPQSYHGKGEGVESAPLSPFSLKGEVHPHISLVLIKAEIWEKQNSGSLRKIQLK